MTVTYTEGSICDNIHYASSVIYVLCSESEEGTIEDVSIGENYCYITLVVKAKAGCGTKVSGGIGAGGIILIM